MTGISVSSDAAQRILGPLRTGRKTYPNPPKAPSGEGTLSRLPRSHYLFFLKMSASSEDADFGPKSDTGVWVGGEGTDVVGEAGRTAPIRSSGWRLGATWYGALDGLEAAKNSVA